MTGRAHACRLDGVALPWEGSRRVYSKRLREEVSVEHKMRRGALSWLVFFAGTGSMATEMCASRLLAPYYGSSTMIWANIIGLMLIALSVGYVLGGKLADRHPSPRALGIVVLCGAVLTAVVPFAARPFSERHHQRHRLDLCGGRGRLVLCLCGALRPLGGAVGHGQPLRHPLGHLGRGQGRLYGRPHLRPIHRRQSGGHLRASAPASIPLIGTQRTLLGHGGADRGRRHPAAGRSAGWWSRS